MARGQMLTPHDRDAINHPRDPQADEIKRAFGEGGVNHRL